jgi:hypothetical protein
MLGATALRLPAPRLSRGRSESVTSNTRRARVVDKLAAAVAFMKRASGQKSA